MAAAVTGIAYLGMIGEWSIPFSRRYEIVYRVLSDDDAGSVIYALAATGLPVIGVTTYSAPGEADPLALCRSLKPKRLTDVQWEITATFATQLPGGRDGRPENWPENPLYRPIEWRVRAWSDEEVQLADLDGKAFINILGDPYPPEVARVEWGRNALVLTKNYPNCPMNAWGMLVPSINSRAFWGYAAGCLKFEEIEAQEQFESGMAYVRATFTFLSDREAWWRWVAHQGPQYKDAKGRVRFFSDDLGHASTNLGYLNVDGTRRTIDEITDDRNKYEWVNDRFFNDHGVLYEAFRRFDSLDWSLLQLG